MSTEEVGKELLLGKRLQQARQKAGLTQQQLCDSADLSYSTLAKIERGAIRAPSIFTVQSIADVIGVSLDELVGHEVSGAVKTNKKTSKSGIKFVYFDINGCLVRFYHTAFTALSAETGISLGKIESAFWHYNDDVNRGEMTMDEFNAKLAGQLGVPKIDWNSHYLTAVEPIREMRALTEWVAEHYNIGLMSNIMPGVIDAMLAKNLLPDVEYTAIVDSSEVHAIKPEAKIYEVAQGLTGVQPNEILLVDDTAANIMAAERKGWSVMWFDDYKPADSAKRIKQVLEF